MGFLNRIKSAFSGSQSVRTVFSGDPCEDQTFIPLHTDKKISIFVSSTFRDMIAERDELTLRIFPLLRKECEKRGVAWSEVDLRWGIPPEKSRQGETLGICLQYIDRCRPYFIGILGERYGWIDPGTPSMVTDDFPWVQDQTGKSITELEILHGVLNNPRMEDHAFFYFRSPQYLQSDEFKDTTPESERSGFSEENEENKEKLASLKKRIRDSGFPVRENYKHPAEFGEMVRKDLMSVIESLAPELPEDLENQGADRYLERELAAHERFISSRFGIYVKRKDYFDLLTTHATKTGKPVVLSGEPGSGKSALLAHWAYAYREAHPSDLVLTHFVGASSASTDWELMLRRLMGELKRECGIRAGIPEKSEDIRPAFLNFLSMAGKRRNVVLVIDALDQLDEGGGALELTWLPITIPDGIRLIVSTLQGKSLDEVRRRGFEEIGIRSLTDREARQMITCFYRKYHKEPHQEMISFLLASPRCKNPLFLRIVLEEIRVHGRYEHLGEQIEALLEAGDITTLYDKILSRYEQDYEKDRPGLVRDSMSLIWASRRGLSKSELMDLLSCGNGPLPDAVWAPLYLAAEQAFSERAGLLTFSHEQFREAVRQRYLQDSDLIRQVSHQLAAYFHARPEGSRRLEELPWQLAQAGMWDALCELLTGERFLIRLFLEYRSDLYRYWADIEMHSSLRMVDAYRPVIDAPEGRSLYLLNYLGVLLWQFGHYPEAARLTDALISRTADDPEKFQAVLGQKANLLVMQGDLDGAMVLFREKERICRNIGNREGLSASLGNQANIRYIRGDLTLALALLRENEKISRSIGDQDGIQTSIGNQANILTVWGDYQGALTLLKEQWRISLETGDVDGQQGSLGNQAKIHYHRGNYEKALLLLKEQEKLCRQIGDKNNLQTALGNQGLIYAAIGEPEKAREKHAEEERICRETGHLNGLQGSLGNQALLLKKRGCCEKALDLLREQEKICRELGNRDGLQHSLGNQANILADQGSLEQALALNKEKEEICRDLDNQNSLQIALANQAALYLQMKEYDTALDILKEEELICRKLDKKSELQKCLGLQASISADQGNHEYSLTRIQEQERLSLESGNPRDIISSLLFQAADYIVREEMEEAVSRIEKASRLAEENNLPEFLEKIKSIRPDIADGWFNRGISLDNCGQYAEAISAFDNALQLCPDDADFWNNKGTCYDSLGNYEAAISSYERAIALKPDVPISWYNKGISLKNLNRYEDALDAYDRAISLDPSDADIYYNKGNALVALKRFEAAIHEYKAGIALKPDESLWNNMGRALFDLGRYEEALVAFEEALKIRPGDAGAWKNKGDALTGLSRDREAADAYHTAQQLR